MLIVDGLIVSCLDWFSGSFLQMSDCQVLSFALHVISVRLEFLLLCVSEMDHCGIARASVTHHAYQYDLDP